MRLCRFRDCINALDEAGERSWHRVCFFVNEQERERMTCLIPANANRGGSRNVSGRKEEGRVWRWLYVLSHFDSAALCGLRGVGVEVSCSRPALSPLTSGRGRSTHSSYSPPPLKQLITLNSCIPHCTNPQHLALPPTHSLWQSDRHIYRRPRTPTLPSLMASCSRLMFKARGLAWRPVISCAELWKHRLHFCGLLQTARLCLRAIP